MASDMRLRPVGKDRSIGECSLFGLRRSSAAKRPSQLERGMDELDWTASIRELENTIRSRSKDVVRGREVG